MKTCYKCIGSNLKSNSFADMDKSQSLSRSHQNDLDSIVKTFDPIDNLPEPENIQQSCKYIN